MKNKNLDNEDELKDKSEKLENEKVKNDNSEEDIYKIIQSMSDCVWQKSKIKLQ